MSSCLLLEARLRQEREGPVSMNEVNSGHLRFVRLEEGLVFLLGMFCM